jgi:predicted PurR-regulated permease PerM
MKWQRHIGFWLGAAVVFFLFLFVFRSVLLPFVAGMALAYGLDPIADWFQRRGLSRLAASLTILVIFVLLLVVLLVVFVPLLANQLASFIDHIPTYTQQLQGLAAPLLQTRLGQYLKIDPNQIKNSMGTLMSQGASWMTTLLASHDGTDR